ncbi:MAG: hypothetical protein WCT35_07455 [Sideroxydans sp.]|jgi:hypothetical protein
MTMFGNDLMLHEGNELELQIERTCIALGLDFHDEYQVRMFARDVLQNIDRLRKAAREGDMEARIKVELYGLAMLMHKTNSATFGSNYLNQFAKVTEHQSAWAAIAQALWRELEARNPDNIAP